MILLIYDAPHRKTYDFIMALTWAGYTIDCIYAAPWEQITSKPELINLSTQGLYTPHTRLVAEALRIPYIIKRHDEIDGQGELGVIAGARILKAHVVDTFSNIINIHPGKLPEIRGLDTVKHSILKDVQMMVTAHYIDAKIDRGRFLCEEPVNIYKSDSMKDIFNRMMSIQPRTLLNALDSQVGHSIGLGAYCATMTPLQETHTLIRFTEYKRRWSCE